MDLPLTIMANRNERYYNFNSMHGFVTINYGGGRPKLSIAAIKEGIQNWCSTRNTKAKVNYIAMSTTNENGTNHSHVFFQLEESMKIHKKPMIRVNGIDYNLYFTPVTEHAAYDGSFARIIKYLKNQSAKHNTEAKFEEMGKFDADKGKVGNNVIEKALRIPDLNEAMSYLRGISATWYLNNVKKFKDIWREQNGNKQTNRISIKLSPWKEDNTLVKNARAWLQGVKLSKQKRIKTLVILGETRIGKTEFINDLLKDMRVDEFRGHFMFDGHNENKTYDIRLFDDANLRDIHWFEFKALLSTRGEQITVNIKYDHATVTSIPTILIMNTNNWDILKNIAKENSDADWLEKNTIVLFSKEPLFEKPQETKKTIEQLKELYGDLDPSILQMFNEDDEEQMMEEDLVERSDFDEELDTTISDDLLNMPVPPPLLQPPIEYNNDELERREKRKNKILGILSQDKSPLPPRDPDVELTREAQELASRWPRFGDKLN